MRHIKYLAMGALVSTLGAWLLGPIVWDTPSVAAPPSVKQAGKAETLLFVRTRPKGAEILLDGKKLGKSDGLFPVESGAYKIVLDLEGYQPQEQQITVRDGRITRIELTLKPRQADGAQAADSASDTPERRGGVPQVVGVWPAVGAVDVDPAASEIIVIFDQDMGRGMSWTGGGPEFPPIPEGKRPVWRDRRTCVLPVKLDEARYYRVGINSTSYQNFQSAQGVPVRPSAIYFVTRGASEELKNRVRRPEIVSITPPNGAKDVDPGLREIRVTFNVPMGDGCSWTGGGPNFPTIPQGQRPTWSADGKTCVLPVELKPGWDYRLGLNSPSHKNFTSQAGVPLEPVVYTFRTRQP